MADTVDLELDERQALEEIRQFLRNHPTPYGQHKLDELAMRYAQELIRYPPSQAMAKAREFRDKLKALNEKEEQTSLRALASKQELKEHPIYNVGRPGLVGMVMRSMLASINGTPLDAINWFELTERGLVLHTPIASVAERVITNKDLQEKRVELGVDPAAYFDLPLAWLKQLRFKVQAPWGRLSVREPGSGVVLGEIVTFKPEQKLARIRAALATLARAADPYARHKLLPSIADFLSYYLDEWDSRYPPALSPTPRAPRGTIGTVSSLDAAALAEVVARAVAITLTTLDQRTRADQDAEITRVAEIAVRQALAGHGVAHLKQDDAD